MSQNQNEITGLKDPLVLLVDPDTLEVDYYNLKAKLLFGFNGNLAHQTFFLKSLVHPEDLNSIGDLSGPISLRYRATPEEGWDTLLVQIKRMAGKLMLVEDFWNQNLNSYGLSPSEYDDLLNSLDEAFCIVELIYDKEGIPFDYLYLNNNAAFGNHVSFDSVAGKTVRELVDIPKADWLKIFGEIAITGKPVRLQEKNKNLDNAWLDLYAFKVGKKDSRKLAILFRNITIRKEQEEEIKGELQQRHQQLVETSELLQNVFDNTDVAVALIKPISEQKEIITDFKFIRVNRVLENLYPEKNLTDSTLQSAVVKRDFKVLLAFFKEAIQNRNNLEKETKLKIRNKERWVRVKVRIQTELLIVSLEDITQRKKEAEELRESIQFKKHLVRTTPEIIMILDLNTRKISYINKDIFSETGVSSHRARELSFEQIVTYVHPNDRTELFNFHYKILKSNPKKVSDLEIRLRINNQWEFYSVRGKVFKKKKQRVEQYMLVVRNIHEQKKIQHQLLKAQRLSIQGDVAKTFAHELRNPLASIGMVSELMKKKLPGEEFTFLKPYFEILDRSKSQINDLVSDLLNSSNYSPAVLEKESLTAIVESSLEKAQDRIYLVGIKVEKSFKGDNFVLADKEKLQIAILNILVNASEAVTPGEGIIAVSVTNKDNLVILKISDNGAGIEKEHLSKLFDAFYSKKENGLGIGLNAVRNILEEHDADIEVSSEPGKGTCFILKFMEVS